MIRTVALIALACAAFAVATAVLGRLAPLPDMGDLDDKLRWLSQRGERVDVVFVGSSRVLRGIVPETFDAELARRGFPLSSFNFGVDGMGAHEATAALRRVLSRSRRAPRWVVFELDGWSAELPEENRFTARMIAWHDREETGAALAASMAGERPFAQRLERAAVHLAHWGARATGAGRGRDLVRALRHPGERRDRLAGELARLDAGRGFEPFSASAYGTPTTHPLRRRFLALAAVYPVAVARLPAANRAGGEPPRSADVRGVEAVAALVRAAGARPIFLITPTARPTPELYRLAEAGRAPGLLAFNDPAAYPELYTLEHRFDAEHLTTAGAHRFSRALAARFAGEVLAREARAAAPGGRAP